MPSAAFASGILVGDRSGFSDSWEEAFRVTGLTHLLALSGFNVTIIISFVMALMTWLPKQLKVLTVTLLVVLFVLLVGGGAPIVRAAIMGIIGYWVIHTGRQANGWVLLLLATNLMLLWRPLHLLYDPALQLSVAGVAGILAFGEFFKRLSYKICAYQVVNEVNLCHTCGSTWCTTAASLPLWGNIAGLASCQSARCTSDTTGDAAELCRNSTSCGLGTDGYAVWIFCVCFTTDNCSGLLKRWR